MATVERERLETGVLFVGAGPATLSAAIRLVDLCRGRGIDPPGMLVIEKASEIGEHQLSGAVMKPTAIAELIPEWKEKGFPYDYECAARRSTATPASTSAPRPCTRWSPTTTARRSAS
jgi:electron-transferring-flavoprotein dehydrogenase